MSQNDFVDQLLADLTGLKVERSTSSEMTVLGAAFLAGLHEGNCPVCSGIPRGGVWGVQTPSRNSEGPPKLCQTQPDL